MSKQAFEEFRRIVLREPALQGKFREIERRDEFIACVVKLAATENFEITAADVEEAMRDARRAWLEKWI